ncbi:DUF4870 domain-containing protein [Arthrobacter sp. HLT1-20]
MSHPVNQQNGPVKPPLTPVEDKQWAFMAHCGGILGCVPAWLIHRYMAPRGRFTAQESLEALNFTLPPTAIAVLLNLLGFIFTFFNPQLGTVFFLLALLVWAFLTAFSVIAAVSVNKGQPYRYSLNLRPLK